jgi:hypothetical protein
LHLTGDGVLSSPRPQGRVEKRVEALAGEPVRIGQLAFLGARILEEDTGLALYSVLTRLILHRDAQVVIAQLLGDDQARDVLLVDTLHDDDDRGGRLLLTRGQLRLGVDDGGRVEVVDAGGHHLGEPMQGLLPD